MFFRNSHDVDSVRNFRAVESKEFPQEPFHPVPQHRMAGFLAHGQPKPPMVGAGWPFEHEKDETLGVVASASLVTVQELLALDEVKGLRKF